MTKFLLHRPIAVFMVTTALLVFSLLALVQLPVGLLPAISVPSIVIQVEYPNSSPNTIEENILKPIRDHLLTLPQLQDIESVAAAENGQIHLSFSYKASMDLMYIEVNERIDRLQGLLPEDLLRPKVIRLSTGDIPVIRLQVIPQQREDYTEVSKLTTKVLRRRIEQISGVSMVDVIGSRKTEIAVIPKMEKLYSYKITLSKLINTINNSNLNWGAISVKDGQYRYYVKIAANISSSEEILNLPIQTTDGQTLTVRDVAVVEEKVQPALGYHLYNQDRGLAVVIHKQENARMMDVITKIEESVKVFREEYPGIDFQLTQDQSVLLNAGINNLKTALLWGGVFAFAILFIFMSNVRLALIMGLSLPLSLLLSFLVFYLFNISINIISLSGLALGLGMLIDNAIIVLDNISAKRNEGYNIIDSCVLGVKEVQAPLISSVLTTLAVFVPLVFLNGMAGALFYDQAIAVAAILGVSLLVSFSILPLLYKLLFNKTRQIDSGSRLFNFILNGYDRFFVVAWKFKATTMLLIALICVIGIWLGVKLPRSPLPEITRHEFLVKIDWNEPIVLAENEQRALSMLNKFSSQIIVSEAEIGAILNLTSNGRDNSKIYISLPDSVSESEFATVVTKWLKMNYPKAITTIVPAPNAFDQLFSNTQPLLKVKLRSKDSLLSPQKASQIMGSVFANASIDIGFTRETSIKLILDNPKLALYKVDKGLLQKQLTHIFGRSKITTLKHYGENTMVYLMPNNNAQYDLDKLYISSENGDKYPISSFITTQYDQDNKFLTADARGVYQSVSFGSMSNIEQLMADLQSNFVSNGILVDFSGSYFTTRKNLKQLSLVLLISFALLYFILAAQFESFLQPLIIILTLPLGVGGSLLLLYLTGSSLNLMSAIGIIVMLGIMINDAILKLDTINRNVRNMSGIVDVRTLYNAIHQAGMLRLRPILMTSFTTILALLPVLFATGLGSDLQRGLVIAVIGGLTIGTVTSLFFVPLAYYYLAKFRHTL